ncbi:MAG: hypothetical protein ACK5NT_02900 [Pyrinomonadaceae bacterium]
MTDSNIHSSGDDENATQVRKNTKASESNKGVSILKLFKYFVSVVFIVALVLAIAFGGFWLYLRTTPQYSIAILVDATNRDNRETINEIVDSDKIVDDFVPKIVDSAIGLYGKGLSPELIDRFAEGAKPFMPMVKARVKANLPLELRKRTKKFQNMPFPALALGAYRYFEVTYENDFAIVKSKLPDKKFELKMKKDGGVWKIVGLNDKELAQNLAKRYGEQIIQIARGRGTDAINTLGERLGIPNLGSIFESTTKLLN